KLQTQWDNFQVHASDTVLLYALGAGMYRPPWFADVYGEDIDYYFMPYMKGGGGFDYRHPVPRKMILEYLEGAAKFHGQKPYTFVYKGPWEAHPYSGTSISVPGKRTVAFHELGFSKYAVKAFRNYLKDKFQIIAKLNKAWRSSYKSFEDIQPPEKLIRAYIVTKNDRGQDVYTLFFPNKRLPGASTTPLTYEFERCRKDLYCDYLADCYKAIKRGDPKHPLASSTSGGIMNEILINSHDDLQMAERCVDMWGKHPSGGIGWADSPYMYGLNRYFNKTLVALEYYGWGDIEFGEGGHLYNTGQISPYAIPENLYNASRRDIWHEYSWDRRMLLFYGVEKLVELKLPPGGRKWSDGVRPDASPLVRPWTSMIPVVKRRMTNINDILINIPIVKPRIGVLHPGVSIINAYPTDGVQKVTRDVFDRLISKQYHFGVVPEEFIVSGRDWLDNYDVIILPYVQYFDDGFGEKLLDWVSNGGMLISAGPFGLYNKYGFKIKDGTTKVFTDVGFTYPTPDEYKLSWEWNAKRNGEKLSESFLVKHYGRGKVLLTLDGRGFKRAGFVSAEAHVGTEIGAKVTGKSSG
ncbi:MAG: beta-galactosidase, partial [Candidatus Latescibacteria bacterium]|nr:beta-galactosidase [Candidatus Latescibacterota bacterium]